MKKCIKLLFGILMPFACFFTVCAFCLNTVVSKISFASVDYGGYLYILNGGSVTLGAGTVIKNYQADSGGAIYTDGESVELIIDGATISNCSAADWGGAIDHEDGGEGIWDDDGNFISSRKKLIFKSGLISNCSADYAGGIYVGCGNSFEMSGGTISGNTAYEQGGGIQIAESTISLISGGKITGNICDNGGAGILLSDDEFTMTGGEIVGNISVNAPDKADFYCEGNSVLNFYGGTIGYIYTESSVNIRADFTIQNQITLGNEAVLNFESYDKNKIYNIKVMDDRYSGSIIKFSSDVTEVPNLDNFNITGFDSSIGRVELVQDGNGNWSFVLVKDVADFTNNWKSEIADPTYMTVDGTTTLVSPSTIDYLEFLNEIPEDYTHIGTLSTGLKVYQGERETDIAFVDSKKIIAPKYASYLFGGLQKSSFIGFNNFYTFGVIDMSSMFSNCSALTNLDVSSFNTSKATDMSFMFNNCNKLTKLDLSNFDTSNVTRMDAMFQNCQALTSLNVSSFDTSNVTDMSFMFSICSALTSLDVSHFNTSKVTNINAMFQSCKVLTSLDVSQFDTSNVTYMSSMFNNCYVLTNLNVSNFDTSNVTSMYNMFADCRALTSLNVSNFNTSKVTSIYGMFSSCYVLTGLDVSHFDTSNVTSMYRMFYNCSALTSLDVLHFDTSNVTSMCDMFNNCKVLTSLDVSHFYTNKVTNMSSMFQNCQALTSLDVSNFDTSKVTNMSYMFYNCQALTSLDVLSFDTSKVASMQYMFYGCNSLTSLDLSDFNMSNVTTYLSMLAFGSLMLEFKTPYNNKYELPIDACNILEDESGKTYLSVPANTKKSITLKVSFGFPTDFKDEIANEKYMTVDGVVTTVDYTKITSLKILNYVPDGSTQIGTLSTGLKVYQGSSATDIIFADERKIKTPANCNYLFGKMSNCVTMDLSNLDISYATNLGSMFAHCLVLTSLDLSNFNTSNVTSMFNMFNECEKLTSLNISNFDTSKVISMEWMFNYCSTLTELDLSNFNTSNVTYMGYMFKDCRSLTSLDLSNFNTSKVTDMRVMFGYCSSLTSLDLSNFDTSKVTNMDSMFENCCSLTSLNVSNFNTSKVTVVRNMFNSCYSLTSLDLSSFDLSKITAYFNMLNFGSSGKIVLLKTPYNNKYSLTITNGYTLYNENGTAYTSVPANTTSSITLKSLLELPKDWKTELNDEELMTVNGVTTTVDSATITSLRILNYVPDGYTHIGTLSTGVKVYHGTTPTDIVIADEKQIYAPISCSSLFRLAECEVIELINFDTSNTTSMFAMFYTNTKMKKLNVSNFNTSKVTTMSGIFRGCSSLTSLDLSSFDMSSVTGISHIFNFGSSCQITSFKTPYNNTKELTITCANTLYDANGTAYTSVPANTEASITLRAMSEFSATWQSEIKNSTYMTINGVTTTVDPTTITSIKFLSSVPSGYTQIGELSTGVKVYQGSAATDIAFIDSKAIFAPENSFNLFFGLEQCVTIDFSNFNTSKAISMKAMFAGCRKLQMLDLSGFNTSNVTDMSFMFQTCLVLADVNLSSFNTSNVTDMNHMFEACNVLTALDLSNFNTSKVTNMNRMFNSCRSLQNLNLSNFDIRNVLDMQQMFYECNALTSLNVSSFNTSKVTIMRSLFESCKSLKSLDLSGFDMSSVTDAEGMLNFGSSCQITSFKTPYNNTMELTITCANTLYDANGTAYTSVPANTTASITLYSVVPSTQGVNSYSMAYAFNYLNENTDDLYFFDDYLLDDKKLIIKVEKLKKVA